MNLNKGQILISSQLMDEPIFINSNILIYEKNDNGTIGLIINKLFNRPLNDLIEFKNCVPFPLHIGGPMQQDKIYFIHQCASIITGGVKVIDNIYFGGDFNQALFYINNKTIGTNQIKLFLGYCGWNFNQIETEINDKFWTIDDCLTNIWM